MSEGALLVSAGGVVLYSNAAFADMVSVPLERVIGKTLGEFVVHRQEHLLSALLEGAGARAGSGELMLCDPLGNERPVYLSVARNSPGEEPGLSVIVTDLTEQKQNQQIVASERLANAILEQSAEPIIVCDVNGVIMRASGAARTIAGARVLRRHFFHAFPFQAEGEDAEHPVLAALRGNTTAGREMTLAVGGRPVQSFLCTAAPLLDDAAKILGCVVALVDISDRKRVEAARSSLLDAERAARASAEHARFEAEASSRAKDEFLATVSHELRTPLNAMLGWSQLLTNNTLPADKLAHAFEVIQRNVLAQSRLVEDLLDVSRIVSGQMRLEVQPVEPVRVVGAAIESAKPAIEAKHIKLEVDLDPSTGQVLGDATRVQQIVWNLLSNATKFTDKDGKITRARGARGRQRGDRGQRYRSRHRPGIFAIRIRSFSASRRQLCAPSRRARAGPIDRPTLGRAARRHDRRRKRRRELRRALRRSLALRRFAQLVDAARQAAPPCSTSRPRVDLPRRNCAASVSWSSMTMTTHAIWW